MKAQRIYKAWVNFFTLVFTLCAFTYSNAQQPYNYFDGGGFGFPVWNSSSQQQEMISTYPASIIKTLDSNLFISGLGPWGNSLPNGHNKADNSFIKTDAKCNLIWSTRIYDVIGYPTRTYSEGGGAAQTGDSGYVSVVPLQFTDFNMASDIPYIFKFDKNGQYQWAKYYSRDTTYSGTWAIQTPVKAIISNYSGGFLFAINYSVNSSGPYYLALINCDKDGNIIWKKYYIGITIYPTKIIKTPGYGFLICGAGSLGVPPVLIKIDSSGNPQFFKRYYIGTNMVYNFSISEWNNGQYFITGSNKTYNTFGSYSPFIISIDVLGNTNWAKVYNGNNGNEDSTVFPSDISVLRYGDLLVCGARERNGGRELSLFKTDNSGNWIWARSKKGPWATYEGQQLLRFGDDVMMTWGGNYTNWTFAHLSSTGEGICNYDIQNWNQVSVTPTTITDAVATNTNVIINILPPPINFQFIYGIPDSVFCPSGNTAVNEIDSENLISIYPNPTSGVFQIQLGNGQLAVGKIEIYNVLGECIYQLPNQPITQLPVIDISKQPDGIYFVRIQTEKGMAAKKIIIAR